MSHPIRSSFCPLLFAENGGEFDPITNRPILDKPTRGLCGKAYDCGECSILSKWIDIQKSDGWNIYWECIHCLKETTGEFRLLPGFYQSGRIQNLSPEDPNFDPDYPKLSGCTRCGWQTSFCQLVLRK